MSGSGSVQNTIQCMHLHAMCMIHLKIKSNSSKNRTFALFSEGYLIVLYGAEQMAYAGLAVPILTEVFTCERAV